MNNKSSIELIIKSFLSLDVSYLNELPSNIYYSTNTKKELIEQLSKEFASIKSKEINKLLVKPSKCKYCYPDLEAYSFYTDNDEFVSRYLISKTKKQFIVKPCKNKLISDDENGMPF
ncbi:hypothetical protein [Mesonia mobilis]|uniref:Uncharacterized protein n=1 Tax=Mesonia mobilis TaxID=369791 RepID=A0ABQ3BVV7_9FLAO|nr:hypothetical protein [Mesonia mobilis]GGZ56402.1 hypothetical protein GCM10008088_17470 [Mesonia mobilis]